MTAPQLNYSDIQKVLCGSNFKIALSKHCPIERSLRHVEQERNVKVDETLSAKEIAIKMVQVLELPWGSDFSLDWFHGLTYDMNGKHIREFVAMVSHPGSDKIIMVRIMDRSAE